MASDRILGLVALFVALAYIASATQIQTSFLSDPVGPKSFPILVGVVAAICSLVLILKPDPDPDWPVLRTFGALLVAVVVLVAYAYALKPLGFLLPTALASAVLTQTVVGFTQAMTGDISEVVGYQISPRAVPAWALC